MLDIDTAIKHCLEVAGEQSRLYSLCPCPCDGTKDCMSLKNGKDMGCTKCAADQRQFAEWLMELKKLREENIALKNHNERLRDCVDNCVYNGELDYAELSEAKRLLKAAVDDIEGRSADKCKGCIYENVSDRERYVNCTNFHCYEWRYADEALNLIGGS